MGIPIAPADPLNVTSEQRKELVSMAKSTVLPHRSVVQAKALLLAADGTANEAIARKCSATPDTVRRWRRRFETEGVKGIGKIASGRGRKPSITNKQIEAIVADTIETVSEDGSACWTDRSMGERHGVSKDTIARIWRARKLRPCRQVYSVRRGCSGARSSPVDDLTRSDPQRWPPGVSTVSCG